MRFKQQDISRVPNAQTVEINCSHCNNTREHILVEQPYGVSFGLPFMSKPLWSSHKAFALMCPVCLTTEPISSADATKLINPKNG